MAWCSTEMKQPAATNRAGEFMKLSRSSTRCGAERQAPFGNRAIRADDKGEWTQQPGCDARERAALANGLAREVDPAGPERTQSAVGGALVVERRPGCEVAPLDERDRQSARGRLGRRHEPVNAAADDQDVERAGTEGLEIAPAHVW